MVDHVVPAGALTEAFAWLATADALGAALGAALGGALTDVAGPTATFALAGVAGVTAVAVCATRRATLPGGRAPHAGALAAA
jgi:predicted MFS family arabinose efflux permease